MRNLFLILQSFILLWSCTDDEIDYGKSINQKYILEIPDYFPLLTFDTIRYPLSKDGVELGRKLFYDGRLSRNNTISCGFCHIQENAFTHHGHAVSHGINDRVGIRNAPAIQNVAFLNRFFWDGVHHDIIQLSISPISSFEEMDSSISEVIEKLNQDQYYTSMFKKVYGDQNINGERILGALGQFMATMISNNSKYDKVIKGEISFTLLEQQGKQLFENKCSSCHQGSLFTDESFRNTGLYYDIRYADAGKYRVTLDSIDFMKFKVPSLRNVELTAPYMHDGRFYTLDAVLDFYRNDVNYYTNLDPLLNQNNRRGITISNQEKEAIIAFLKTLTDYKFISNTAFAEFN